MTREVCDNLKQALERLQREGREINPILVSRSDSTLRGHYPGKTTAQLGQWLQPPEIEAIEIDVERIDSDRQA